MSQKTVRVAFDRKFNALSFGIVKSRIYDILPPKHDKASAIGSRYRRKERQREREREKEKEKVKGEERERDRERNVSQSRISTTGLPALHT